MKNKKNVSLINDQSILFWATVVASVVVVSFSCFSTLIKKKAQ